MRRFYYAESTDFQVVLGAGDEGVRGAPPASLARDDWERWRLVREAVRTMSEQGLPIDEVRRIQRCLRADGAMVSDHGEFDPLTIIGLLWFQHDQDLPMTGVIDPRTRSALERAWPELRRRVARRLAPARDLVPDDAGTLERYLFYRQAIQSGRGLFDDGHREVNVLVLRDAELLQGSWGTVTRSTGTDAGPRSYVTVSLWVERSHGRDDGDVVGLSVRERPGHALPNDVRTHRQLSDSARGQYLCDLGAQGPHLPQARAWLGRDGRGMGCVPFEVDRLPLVRDLRPGRVQNRADPRRLGWRRFYAELMAMKAERIVRTGWKGVRLTILDASRIEPLER